MTNFYEDIVCPECGGSMVEDSNPVMVKCFECGHRMSMDEVKGVEEYPLEYVE